MGYENTAYRIVFAFVAAGLALIPLKLTEGNWYELEDPEFPPTVAPLSKVWDVHTYVDIAMIACTVAVGFCLLSALPLIRPLRLRFRVWLVAVWALAVTSSFAAAGVLFRAAVPPSLSAVGWDSSSVLSVSATGRPWVAGLVYAVLAFLAISAALLEASMLKEIPVGSRVGEGSPQRAG